MEQTKEQKLVELNDFIDGLSEKDGSLISVLHKAQDIYGYLSVETQNHVARKLGVPAAKVYGVVTFYSFFNTKPKGRLKVSVCLGTACFVRGAESIVDEFKRQLAVDVGQTTEDGMFSLDCLRCVGACGLAPVVSVNGRVYGRVTKDDVKKIIEEQMVEGSLV